MSHFTVMVIGDDVDGQLQAFHEFECTGTDDQYVQDIDRTEEVRESFANATTRVARRISDGSIHRLYDEEGNYRPEFSRKTTGGTAWENGRTETFIPEGYEEVQVPSSSLMTLAEYASDNYGWKIVKPGSSPQTSGDDAPNKYGYILVGEKGDVLKCVDRTNPGKRWDWWVIGGRWTGYFRLIPGRKGVSGKPGVMTEPAKRGYADQAKKGDIDFEAMRHEHVAERLAKYRLFHATVNGRPIPKWSEIRERHGENIDVARNEFHDNPVTVALKNLEGRPFDWDDFEDYDFTEAEFTERARNNAISTFAAVKDSKWYEKGEMGWFACVHNEKDQAAWDREFNAMLDALPDDTLLTVVDCHI